MAGDNDSQAKSEKKNSDKFNNPIHQAVKREIVLIFTPPKEFNSSRNPLPSATFRSEGGGGSQNSTNFDSESTKGSEITQSNSNDLRVSFQAWVSLLLSGLAKCNSARIAIASCQMLWF